MHSDKSNTEINPSVLGERASVPASPYPLREFSDSHRRWQEELIAVADRVLREQYPEFPGSTLTLAT